MKQQCWSKMSCFNVLDDLRQFKENLWTPSAIINKTLHAVVFLLT